MKKNCIITGASRGLGEKLSYRFWDAGYNLHLISRNDEDLKNVKKSLSTKPLQECTIYASDLSEHESVINLIDKLNLNMECLDVLINNAAIQGPIGELELVDFTEWQKTIQVNLLAPAALCQGLIPLLAKKSGGAIINLSGGGASTPRANFSAYAASKAGLVRLTETLAQELTQKCIRVNAIAPGSMKTKMLGEVLANARLAGEHELASAKKVFSDGGASMDRVADLALFLASESGRSITGKLISVVWDNWEEWSKHLSELSKSDVYTLRRITGRDRGFEWGDK